MTISNLSGMPGYEQPETRFWAHYEYNDLREFVTFLDQEIDTDWLLDYLQAKNAEFSNRKEFCEILGIGESTLSGWLKGDRIPKMAKVIIGLLKSRELDREERKDREVQIENLRNRDRIVQDGDRFLIVEFSANERFGRIVARDIPDLATAQKFNLRYSFVDLLKEIHANSAFWEGDDEVGYLEHLKVQIEEALTAEEWITSAKRRSKKKSSHSAESIDGIPSEGSGDE